MDATLLRRPPPLWGALPGRNARGAGTVVLRSRSYERESVRGQALDGLVDSLSRSLTTRLQRKVAAALERVHVDPSANRALDTACSFAVAPSQSLHGGGK